jgi:hypothetical protein
MSGIVVVVSKGLLEVHFFYIYVTVVHNVVNVVCILHMIPFMTGACIAYILEIFFWLLFSVSLHHLNALCRSSAIYEISKQFQTFSRYIGS